MVQRKKKQLSHLVDSKAPKTVLAEVRKIFSSHYSKKDFYSVKKNCLATVKLFKGKFKGYRACNTNYHDLSHTMDAFLAVARLIDGYNIKETPMSVSVAVNLLNAALFHDSGYIQKDWDLDGTGAKYTENHIERSIDFLQENHQAFVLDSADLPFLETIIRCTGLNVAIDEKTFGSHEEFIAGCIIGTADLLGQMSDRSYLEKLLFLYREFREAGVGEYSTEFDILKNTIGFYEITLKRLKGPLQAAYEFARHHFKERHGTDHNLYMEAIERHMAYLQKIIEDDSTNFRHKLKRGDWVQTFNQEHSH